MEIALVPLDQEVPRRLISRRIIYQSHPAMSSKQNVIALAPIDCRGRPEEEF